MTHNNTSVNTKKEKKYHTVPPFTDNVQNVTENPEVINNHCGVTRRGLQITTKNGAKDEGTVITGSLVW